VGVIFTPFAAAPALLLMLQKIYDRDLGPAIAAALLYLHLSHTPDISCEWQLPTFIPVIHTQSNLATPTLRHHHYHTTTNYYYYYYYNPITVRSLTLTYLINPFPFPTLSSLLSPYRNVCKILATRKELAARDNVKDDLEFCGICCCLSCYIGQELAHIEASKSTFTGGAKYGT